MAPTNLISKARDTITVEPVLFLYMLGAFLQYKAVQQLIHAKVCAIKFNNSICSDLTNYSEEDKAVTTEASHWLIVLNIALTVPSVISSLILGPWSDNAGRRCLILLPTIGTIVYCGFLIVSAHYITLSLWIIITGQAILGVTGAYPVLTSAVFSYLGDVATAENKTQRFGILESMTFIGSCVGLLTSGFVIDNLGFVAVFVYVMICEVLIVLYVLLWLRESVPNHLNDSMMGQRSQDDGHNNIQMTDSSNGCATLFRVQHIMRAFAAVFRRRQEKRRLQIIFLVACLFIFELVGTGEKDTVTYYVMEKPLSWSSTYVGIYSGSLNLAKGLALIVVLPLIQRLGLGDPLIAVSGSVLRVAGYLLMAFAQTTAAMFSVVAFMAFAGIPAACTRAMLSSLVSTSEQGSLFSFTASLETLTGLLGSVIFNALYPATMDIIRGGFIYLLMAGLLIVPIILLLWLRDLKKFDINYDVQSDEENKGNS